MLILGPTGGHILDKGHGFMKAEQYHCPVCGSEKLRVTFTYRKPFAVAVVTGSALVLMALLGALVEDWLLPNNSRNWIVRSLVWFVLLYAFVSLTPGLAARVSARDFLWKCRTCGESRPLKDLKDLKDIENQAGDRSKTKDRP
jgi:hypothetical protein